MWREAGVSVPSPPAEDAAKEGPYLAKSSLFSELLQALPRVAGALPRAPVSTQLQHLQLLRPRPGPAQSPAPEPAYSRGGAHANPPSARSRLRALPARVFLLLGSAALAL